MNRLFLFTGPVLMLASCMAAFASDGTPPVPDPSMLSPDHLLTLGPYGALVWGAYLLGKGAKVTVQIELSEEDRKLLETFGKTRQS